MQPSRERMLTILFTDVEGSTQLRSQRGDAFADEILGLHEQIVRGQLAGHGGESVQFLGDGFLAAFPSATAAVDCAVAIQRALAEHNRTEPGRQVQVRIGLHRGPVSQRGGNLYGQAVHAAARVTAEAAGGQIFMSAAIRDGLGDGLPVLDRGLYWLKGFPRRWRLYEVVWGQGAAAQPGAATPGATPFVEREEERADLRRWVDGARNGHGHLVLLGGEAGVGKTRLREEVQADAETLGMRVLVGHCAEMDVHAPYLPFVEILEEALLSPRSPLALRDALADDAPEIARLVPGLRRVLPDIPAPIELPPEQARRYLWNSVLEFVERASFDRPLLLVLEDLHWADESTVLLVEHLAPRLAEMPVLVCGTYRDTEVPVDHPLAQAMDRLLRRRLASRLLLGRLTAGGVGSMLAGLAGAEPPARLVEVIHAETDGNPFFVQEVYLHLAESGRLLDEQGRFRADLSIDDLDVPETIRLAVGGRLARLGEHTRAALVAAAVLGRVFPVGLVASVADQPGDLFADGLDEAERARLLVPLQDDEERLAFFHELIRQTLLADVTVVRRQRLHARAADAIEEAYADDIEEHAAEVVFHLSRAGAGVDHRRFVRFLTMAGDRADQAAAFGDALAHFQRALALVGESEPGTRAALLERVAMAQRGVGEWADALEAMDGALDLYATLGDTEAVGRLCWAMAYQLAWTTRFEEAVGVAGRGQLLLGDLPHPDRARLISAIGWAVSLSGDFASAAAMFEQARSLVESLGDKRALADVLHMETVHDFGWARFSHGVEIGLDAAVVFEADGALWDLCSVLSFVMYQQGASGRREQATDLRARVAPMAARLGHLGAMFLALADRVKADGVMCGDLALVEAIGREQIEVCERGQLPWLYIGHLYVGLAAHWRGDWDEAERELRLAGDLEARGAFSGQSKALLAQHLAVAGRFDEVVALYEESGPFLPVAGQVGSLGTWNTLMTFAEALYLAGRREEVAAMQPLFDEMAKLGEWWDAIDCRIPETRAGVVAAAAGRFDDAEGRFRAAARQAERLQSRIEAADVRRLHAMMLLDRGEPADRERARGLLDEALAAYDRIGMPRHRAAVEALLA